MTDLTIEGIVEFRQTYETPQNDLQNFKQTGIKKFVGENDLSPFIDQKRHDELEQTGACYTGDGKDIAMKKMCDAFCINNGVCDRCGKLIPPWYKYGLCPKCNEEMDESNIIPWFEEFIGLRR